MFLKTIQSIFKSVFQLAFQLAMKHKIIAVIVAAAIIGGGYFGYHAFAKSKNATQYLVSAVAKGTLIVSVSGSGQVSSLDQVEIKPKVSGNIKAIYISKDQGLKEGQLIATLDSKDAERSVRDAQNALDKAQRDLDDAKESYQEIEIDANNSLATAYEDGYSSVSTTFFKLSDYMKDLKDSLGTENSAEEYITGYELVLGKDSLFIQKLLDDYDKASDLFNKNFAFFRTVFQNDDHNTIYELIDDTIDTTKVISQALESARHMYDAAVMNESYKNLNIASQIDKMQSKIESDVSSVYSNISSIQQIKDTIDNTNKDTPKNIESAQLAIQSAQDTVTQKEEAFSDAKEKLAEYYIRAPFSGIAASVDDKIKIGDSVSSGTVLVTLITKQKIAQISFNEIDAAKVKTDQKATLALDAVPDLEITGSVFQVDTLGTVSQGVVSYTIQIAFDTQDERVKPGMSVSASIIVDVATDVLMVPNTSVKSQGESYYVQMPADQDVKKLSATLTSASAVLSGTLKTQPVEIGLANDDYTQITSGLQEGDIVITGKAASTTTSSTSSTRNQQGGSFRMPGF
jgi:HlyD family secretion protein